VRRKKELIIKKYDYTQSQYVSETEEDMYSDEDDKAKKKKIKVFSLGYFSQLMNKKIYSDDFDMSSDKIRQKKLRNYASSLVECPISEDVESED
jgi:hypothetical protein